MAVGSGTVCSLQSFQSAAGMIASSPASAASVGDPAGDSGRPPLVVVFFAGGEAAPRSE